MSTAQQQASSHIGEMDLTVFTDPENRENSVSLLNRYFPGTSETNILAKYEKETESYLHRKASERSKGAALAIKIIAKKKTVLKLLEKLTPLGLSPACVVPSVINIAKAIEPGAPISTKNILELAGARPAMINAKWWNDSFPTLLDDIGITLKSSRTERRFLEVQELEANCQLMTFVCQKLGDTIYGSTERLAGRLIDNDAFVERTKSGEVIVHERPHETLEGKEAARKAQQAKFLYEMKVTEKKYSITEFDDEYAASVNSFKTPIVIVSIVSALLVLGVAVEVMNPKAEINPAVQNQQVNASVFADDESEYEYLADEVGH